MPYKCNNCAKTYNLKLNYDNHINVCSFINKSTIEQENDIDLSSEKVPNNFETYQLIKHMMKKINSLENEVKRLKQKENKTINVVEYLNANKNYTPILSFHEWLEQEIVPLVPNHLQDVFDKNLPEGVNALFNRYKDTANNVVLPIYSFVKNKQHITCIYQDNKWEILENRKMNNYINFICDEFVAVFTNIWYTQNKIKISKDEKLKDLYLLYNKKVLGDGKKKEQLQNKIREDIKICFKQKINGIVSVEVE